MRRVLAPIVAPLAVLLTLAAAGPAPAAPASNSVVGGSPRVVGGSPATTTDAPWQALVLPDGYLCGGAILDATHVVTAAHCVYDDEDQEILAPSAITVHAGITNRFAAGQHPTVTGGQRQPRLRPRHADRRRRDPDARHALQLQRHRQGDRAHRRRLPARAERRAAPQRLGLRRRPRARTTPRQPHAVDNLNVATLYPSTGCATVYAPFDDNLLLCAGQAGIDACQGDSGGPLAVQVGGVWKLAGIVTGGAGCAWAGYPGYYARVANPDIHAFLADRGAGYAVQDPTVVSPPAITGDAGARRHAELRRRHLEERLLLRRRVPARRHADRLRLDDGRAAGRTSARASPAWSRPMG